MKPGGYIWHSPRERQLLVCVLSWGPPQLIQVEWSRSAEVWSVVNARGLVVIITSILYIHVFNPIPVNGQLASVLVLLLPSEIQLTINFSLCCHGYTGATTTHSILHPDPHFILGWGSEVIQSCRQDIAWKHLCLKMGLRFSNTMILHHIASDWAAPIISGCSPLYRYGGGGCCLDSQTGRCSRN